MSKKTIRFHSVWLSFESSAIIERKSWDHMTLRNLCFSEVISRHEQFWSITCSLLYIFPVEIKWALSFAVNKKICTHIKKCLIYYSCEHGRSPVGWNCKIWQLNICWGVRIFNECPDMRLNNLIIRLFVWSFLEVRLHSNYSQVHSVPE